MIEPFQKTLTSMGYYENGADAIAKAYALSAVLKNKYTEA